MVSKACSSVCITCFVMRHGLYCQARVFRAAAELEADTEKHHLAPTPCNSPRARISGLSSRIQIYPSLFRLVACHKFLPRPPARSSTTPVARWPMGRSSFVQDGFMTLTFSSWSLLWAFLVVAVGSAAAWFFSPKGDNQT